MRDFLQFIYDWYEYYFILLSGGIGILLGLKYKGRRIWSIRVTCFYYILLAVINFVTAILFKHHFFPERSSIYEHIALFGMECILTLGLGIIYVLVWDYIIELLIGLKVEKFRGIQWGLIIFLYLFIELIFELPEQVDYWVSLWYATDYSMGIGSRFFIGTILSFFNKDYLEHDTVYGFCFVTMLIIIALISMILNEVIKKSKNDSGIIYIIIVFFSLPGFVSGMWTADNWGRLETYGLLIGLVSIIIFEKISNIYVRYLIVTVLSCVSIAIYQGNIFMYYPMIVMLFVYDGIQGLNKLVLRRLLAMFSVVCTGMTFLFFQFGAYTIYENVDEMAMVLRNKTNLLIAEQALDLELFQPISVAFDTINKNFLQTELPRERTFLTVLALIPVVYLIVCLYYSCRKWRIENRRKIVECPYIYFVILPCSILPQYLLNMDWGRYMIATTILVFTEIIYLWYKQDGGMCCAIERFNEYVERNKVLYLVLILYLAGFEKFQGGCFMKELDTVTEWLINGKWIMS